MSTNDADIEQVAQALHAEACRVMDTEEPAWDYLPEELREMYRGQARAAVAAKSPSEPSTARRLPPD